MPSHTHTHTHTVMAHEGSPIDWEAFYEAGRNGLLMDLLVKLPRERWAKRDGYDNTLLHCACLGRNVAAAVALLQSGRVDVDARTNGGATPAHFATDHTLPCVLEVLCAAGADPRAHNVGGYASIDRALWNSHRDGGGTVRVLVANGVRLSTARKDYCKYITPELEAFERGVLRCRAAVVAMLRVKQAGKLWMWDKFLLGEMAVCVWSTRSAEGW